MMDLQKERQAFEKLPDINAILHNSEFGFNEDINQYYHPNHTEHRLSYAFLMGAWSAWQAAKAQAVPDLSELQERIAGHQYYHDEHGHMIVDMDDVVKEISGFDSWKAQAVPEGFVLIKDDTKTVVAIERMVEQQVEASGMDSRRLERLDGWKIIEAAVKAQEPAK